MKKYIFISLIVILFSLIVDTTAQAATYSVKQDGTGDFTTIQACANVAHAGDTCLVSAGTYNEHVKVNINGGTDDSHRVTFKAQGTVTMRGFYISKPYVTVDGFDITGQPVPSDYAYITIFAGGDNCKITNNTIRDGVAPLAGIMINISSSSGSANNCTFTGNQMRNLWGSSNAFISTGGYGHVFENNLIETANGLDMIHPFGHDIVFRHNIFRNSQLLVHNHADWVQVWGNNHLDAYNIVFEYNWIQNLSGPYQIAQLNSGDLKTELWPGVHDFIFRYNVFVDVDWNFNAGLPGVQLTHNTFYHAFYNANGIASGGDLVRDDSSRALVKNNVFANSGKLPDSYGWNGYYSRGMAFISRCEDLPGLIPADTIDAAKCADRSAPGIGIFDDLHTAGFIDANGGITDKARNISSAADLTLEPEYETYRNTIYNIVTQTVALESLIRNTTVVDYNFVTGGSSDGWAAKRHMTPEQHGINGGDPMLTNASDPLGPDGIPFTLDDGLKPLPGSPLCGKGEGGIDIGVYSCDPAVVFAGGGNVLYGDVSGDGTISAYDAALAAQYAVGLITLTSEQITRADVSGDGSVSAYDAALIAQKAVGLIDKFPVEG